MRALLNLICNRDMSDLPPIVRNGMLAWRDRLNGPLEPIMAQEEFDALPRHKKSIMKCNFIGCKEMVCTHGMLCVEHHLQMRKDD